MSPELEKELRRALAAPEPPAQLAERILARVAEARREDAARTSPPRARAARHWLPLALAASLLAALVIPIAWHRQQEEAGLRARAQLIEALRVSSQTLDRAYRMVNQPAHADGGEGSGV